VATTITASPAKYTNYQWSFNLNSLPTTQEPFITGHHHGLYKVDVADEFGATASGEIQVLNAYPYFQQVLCYVSVDSALQVNKLTWGVMSDAGIKSYVVYRETSVTGQLQALDTIPFAEAGTYYDMESKPAESSQGYLIKVITRCDESDHYDQDLHKPIHLTATGGLNGEVNLAWEPYEAARVNVLTYKILRGTGKAEMTVIAEKSGSSNSYTDISPPDGPTYYIIQANVSSLCSPAVLSEQNATAEGTVLALPRLALALFGSKQN